MAHNHNGSDTRTRRPADQDVTRPSWEWSRGIVAQITQDVPHCHSARRGCCLHSLGMTFDAAMVHRTPLVAPKRSESDQDISLRNGWSRVESCANRLSVEHDPRAGCFCNESITSFSSWPRVPRDHGRQNQFGATHGARNELPPLAAQRTTR